MSPAEVKLLLEDTQESRSPQAILTTMAAAGPRISEVAKLKVADIDSSRNAIWIRGGKGRRRPTVVVVAKTAGVAACHHFRWKQPTEWLFPGQKPGQPDLLRVRDLRRLSGAAPERPASPRPFICTRCDTPSPLTCWMRA